MAQNQEDLILIQIPIELLNTAKVLSEERIKHEYNRFGLNYQERIHKIRAGIIGELIFSKYLSFLNIPVLYYMQIGSYDGGFDFRAGKLKIDVKTTLFQNNNNKQIDDCQSLLFNKFNLYVADDYGQAKNTKADLYVQVFIIDETWGLLSGYSIGVPENISVNPNNIFPAKNIPIPMLEPMSGLSSLQDIQPICEVCGNKLQKRERKNKSGQTVIDSIAELMAESYKKYGQLMCNSCAQKQNI